MDSVNDHADRAALPEIGSARVEPLLDRGERVLDWFQPDLDRGLQFDEGIVVLTDRRLILAEAPGDRPVRTWPLEQVATIGARERAGLGTLEVIGSAGRLDTCRFTIRRAAGAHRLVDTFNDLKRGALATAAAAPEEPVCPECGAALPAKAIACPVCADTSTEVEPQRAGWRSLFRSNSPFIRLLWFARPRLAMVSLGFALSIAGTAANLVWPYLTMNLMDNILIPHQEWVEHGRVGDPVDFGPAKWYLLGFFGAAILAWLLTWGRSYVLAWVSERISADLRNLTYAHLQRLSLEFFGGKRTGDLMSRISTDTDRICNFLSLNLLDFISDLMLIAGTAVVLVATDWKLACATLVPLPVIAWLVFHVRSRMRNGFERGNRAWADMTSVLADTIPGIRVVKAFAQEKREVERFRHSNDRVLHANDRINTIWAFFGPIVNLLTQCGLLIIWAFGIWLIVRGQVTVGVLIAFVTYISRIYIRLESMSRMLQVTQRAAASVQRIFEILDRVPSVADPVSPVPVGRLRGEIAFRRVAFRYGNRVVIDDLDLAIRPGEMIGLVGPSGAGKSTLVNLVCRFYDVSEGAILVDGVDIRTFAVEDYRRHIGIVLQEPFLFYGTVAENIAYGRPEATREEIIAAARAARAHEFILRLPDGYDSIVGERGQSLSGGERQRISIARALLIDPKILILDEATSSVDTETEREIQEALDNLIQGRTTIAIAHRLSTLRRADRLVVLERGRIAEVGHQDDLLKTPGAYSRLHRAQLDLVLGRELSIESAG